MAKRSHSKGCCRFFLNAHAHPCCNARHKAALMPDRNAALPPHAVSLAAKGLLEAGLQNPAFSHASACAACRLTSVCAGWS